MHDQQHKPVILDENPGSESKRSDKEQKALFDQQRLKTFHWIFIWGVRIAAVSLAAMFIVRIWHFITPMCWQWLDDTQIQMIDRFLFSGAIGAIVGKYFDEVFDNKNSV